MHKINIKPLSVNRCWQGRRFKTPEYKKYEKDALLMLPRSLEVPDGHLSINIWFGVSSASMDIDNGVKPFIDILQKKYGFNDSRVYHLQVEKMLVPKGSEFVEFKIGGIVL